MENETNNTTENEDEIFRSAVINAWVNSKMERDKSLLTLSSGGIGLLVTLLSFKDVYSECELIFYAISFLAFVTCICSVLFIFTKNPNYLERLLNEDNVDGDKLLGFFDYAALISFCIGIFSTSLIGVLNLI